MSRRIPTANQLPLPLVQELCYLCHSPVGYQDHGLCDFCERSAIAFWLDARAAAREVAVLVTPPLCPTGGTPIPETGSK